MDPRIGQRGAGRNKRQLAFHEAGKFQAEAQRLRMKVQLEKLQSEISSIARKTGISSATQLAKLVPKGQKTDKVPGTFLPTLLNNCNFLVQFFLAIFPSTQFYGSVYRVRFLCTQIQVFPQYGSGFRIFFNTDPDPG